MKERLWACRVCGEMVYEDEGEILTINGEDVAEHYECEDED